ncbi:MAG: TIGR03905 family TSCPD domain-containing protein [Ruminococcaceae bacterium]|nr:TIGR03905 family TSCPD domain-containing protein [Oscillospiraceae bacterium]
MQFTYKTNGVCSRKIIIDVTDNVVENVRFEGGCNGNTQGVAALVKGMKVEDVISRLENIKCGFKNTSCPDQLAKALKSLE